MEKKSKDKKPKEKKQKKIKLKGSSFFDKRKPINKPPKSSKAKTKKSNIFSKSKPLNKPAVKGKRVYKKNNSKPLSNASKQDSNVKYLPDIIEKRYMVVTVFLVLFFVAIFCSSWKNL